MTPRYKTIGREHKPFIRIMIRHLFCRRHGNKKGVIPALTPGNPKDHIKIDKAFKVIRRTYLKHGYGCEYRLSSGAGVTLKGWRIRKFERDPRTKLLMAAGDIIDLRNKMPLKVSGKK